MLYIWKSPVSSMKINIFVKVSKKSFTMGWCGVVCLSVSVCGCVTAWHLLLGIPRLSKFGKCDPWQILRIRLFRKIQNFKNWPLQLTFWPFSLKMRPNFFVKVFLPQNLDFEPNEGALEPPFGFFKKYAYLTKPGLFLV